MYAGPFNLNIWLRSFIRGDLVDEYERKCKSIVKSFNDVSTTRENLNELSSKLNAELTALFNKCVDLREQRERSDQH